MSELPRPGTVLKALADVPNPGGIPADFEATPILILRAGDQVKAYVNVCPHAGRPLSLPSGKTLVSEEKFVICPFHGASFEIETGACVGGPAGKSSLKPVAVTIDGDQVVAV